MSDVKVQPVASRLQALGLLLEPAPAELEPEETKIESMPSSFAIAAAVCGWSPVIITTRMPAVWQRATASLAS